jgi:hypothetical protein
MVEGEILVVHMVALVVDIAVFLVHLQLIKETQ